MHSRKVSEIICYLLKPGGKKRLKIGGPARSLLVSSSRQPASSCLWTTSQQSILCRKSEWNLLYTIHKLDGLFHILEHALSEINPDKSLPPWLPAARGNRFAPDGWELNGQRTKEGLLAQDEPALETDMNRPWFLIMFFSVVKNYVALSRNMSWRNGMFPDQGTLSSLEVFADSNEMPFLPVCMESRSEKNQ